MPLFRLLLLPLVATPGIASFKIVFRLQEGLCCHSSKYFMCSLGGGGQEVDLLLWAGVFGALQLPEALIVSLCGPGASFLSCAVSSACRPL